MDPLKIDAVLSMLDLDELHEALQTVERWEEQGNLSHDDAETWRSRIEAWSAVGGSAQRERDGMVELRGIEPLTS